MQLRPSKNNEVIIEGGWQEKRVKQRQGTWINRDMDITYCIFCHVPLFQNHITIHLFILFYFFLQQLSIKEKAECLLLYVQ